MNVYNSELSKEIIIERYAEYAIILEKSYTIDLVYEWLENIEGINNLYCCLNPIWGEKIVYCTYFEKEIVILSAKGSSIAVNAVERVKRNGAKYVFFLGTCGSTSESIEDGTYIIVDSAVRNDSVSKEYLDVGVPAIADRVLVQKIFDILKKDEKEFVVGGMYTTDARYKENPETLKLLNDRANILAADMETSAVLLVAKYHKIAAAAIKIITDCAVKETEGELKGIFDRNKNFVDFVHPKLNYLFITILDIIKNI